MHAVCRSTAPSSAAHATRPLTSGSAGLSGGTNAKPAAAGLHGMLEVHAPPCVVQGVYGVVLHAAPRVQRPQRLPYHVVVGRGVHQLKEHRLGRRVFKMAHGLRDRCQTTTHATREARRWSVSA